LKIGIMTRSCHQYTEKVLGRFGLKKYIDAIVARDDVENPKANPEHAFHLLRLLGSSANETLLAGDHWLDARCAKKSGLRFIFVRNPGQNVEAIKRYDYEAANSIRDVVDFGEP